jgi:hypothetical protein
MGSTRLGVSEPSKKCQTPALTSRVSSQVAQMLYRLEGQAGSG